MRRSALGQRHHRLDPEALADALEIVASALRAGLAPPEALRIAAESTVWGRDERERVDRVIRLIEQGAATRAGWVGPRASSAADDTYRVIAGVWDVAVQTGAPLADAVMQVAGHIREQARLRSRLDALAAGPRTSQRLLTLLPVVGPVLALLVGADPVSLYGSSAVASGVAVLGLVLTAVGWRWSRHLIAQAGQPPTYRSGRGALRGVTM